MYQTIKRERAAKYIYIYIYIYISGRKVIISDTEIQNLSTTWFEGPCRLLEPSKCGSVRAPGVRH
jgi:hypothetical protein